MFLLKVIGKNVFHVSPLFSGDCQKSLISTIIYTMKLFFQISLLPPYKKKKNTTMHIFHYSSNLVVCSLLFLDLFPSYPICYYTFPPFYWHFGDLSPPLLAQPPLLCFYLLKVKNIICPLLYSFYIPSQFPFICHYLCYCLNALSLI